jgi:hypothetical protein
MAETATIEMQDRELFASMTMQALITREAADMVAKQAVAYADAQIEALATGRTHRIEPGFLNPYSTAAKRSLAGFGAYDALFGELKVSPSR